MTLASNGGREGRLTEGRAAAMSLFRSEPMTLCQLFIQAESAFSCVAELGELGVVQFRDLNPDVNAFQRKFVHEIRRCDELERKLRFVEREIRQDELVIPEDEEAEQRLPQARELVDLEANVDRLESDLSEINKNNQALQKNLAELTELKHLLRSMDAFFDEHGHDLEDEVLPQQLEASGEEGHHVQIGFFAGVLPTARFASFERMLWRVCKGVVFVRRENVDDPVMDPQTGESMLKSVFVVFFQGDMLKTRIKKICDGFHANRYAMPASREERREMAVGVLARLADLNMVLGQARDHRDKVLLNAARSLRRWQCSVHKIKAVYHVLNQFNLDVTQKCLIAEAWCPQGVLGDIQRALKRGTDASDSHVPSILNRMETAEMPPTYNRTNKFTRGFQNIVDAYGVSSYREVNPAPFAVVTFPFLFAVMFGDAGHGLIMFLFGLFLVLREKSLQKVKDAGEIWDTFFNGRYIILLMGLFSIYTGFIYNDVFSKSANIFGSRWRAPDNIPYGNETAGDTTVVLTPEKNYLGTPYPFGLDPVWIMAQNKIPFTNSYKMKMAVILGVMQMLFGVLLNTWNHIYFKDETPFGPPKSALEGFLRRYLNVWCQLLPEVLFLGSLFGYLVALIVYKWTLPNGAPNGESVACSRSLLIMFINMFLMTYTKEPCYQDLLYSTQQTVEKVLLLVASVSVPWLLVAKPLYILYLSKIHGPTQAGVEEPGSSDMVPCLEAEYNTQQIEASVGPTVELSQSCDREFTASVSSGRPHSPVALGQASLTSSQEATDRPGGERLEMGEVVIHQMIHTIEYCLGAISNTASYLRLWALSLAHAQLSEVLWTMVMKMGLSMSSGFVGAAAMFAVFAAWAGLTISILLVMEGLSAFLHALRLHWVEFMNKFFKGEGHLFTPFDFKEVLRRAAEEA